jgi:hypothetical protein
MRVKSRPFPYVVTQLSDWEILSAYSYCRKLLNPQTPLDIEEFEDICFFFFDGDVNETIETLKEVQKIYTDEFSKRHIN